MNLYQIMNLDSDDIFSVYSGEEMYFTLYVFIFETLEKFRIYFREDAKTVLGLLDFEMFEKTKNGDVVTTSTLRLDPKTDSILEIPTSYFTNIQYINDHELQKFRKAIRTQMQGKGMVFF